MEQSMIQIQNVSKIFETKRGEKVHALNDVSFDVQDNEFITIVGPSGCGKTTLLRLVVGLETATTGQIIMNEEPVLGPRKDVGMVFQQPTLLVWRDLISNVLFPIEILKQPMKKYREEAMRLIDLVGLSGFEHKSPNELSGGMQSRVAICRALIHDPALLAMDEPFAALDAMTREEMSIWLLRLWEERRKTVLFVTHNIREAVLLADRVIVMTCRPARVLKDLKINLPRPRNMKMELEAEFGDYVAEIREMIFGMQTSLPDDVLAESGITEEPCKEEGE
jgi:NitT/TauT family transport system ATP-binding protein